MRQRLCLCTDSDEPSGVGEHMLALAAGLAAPDFRETWDVTVAVRAGAAAQALRRRGEVVGLRIEVLPLSQEAMQAWLADEAFAVLHIHARICWEGHGLATAARQVAVPVVIRSEHLPYLITDPAQAMEHANGLSLVDRVICVSEAAAASHARAGIRREKLAVVRNGVACVVPGRGRAEVRHTLALAPDDLVVITVARFTEQKGHVTLLHAADAILAEFPTVRFLLVGTGVAEVELRSLAGQCAARDAFHFVGHRDDVADLLHASDLFLLPSLFEGLPLVVLEAMSAGLPVVASRVGGTDEAVIDGVTGWLFEAGDAAELARVVIAALADPAAARRAGDAGRSFYLQEFQLERMVKQTHEIYLESRSQVAADTAVTR